MMIPLVVACFVPLCACLIAFARLGVLSARAALAGVLGGAGAVVLGVAAAFAAHAVLSGGFAEFAVAASEECAKLLFVWAASRAVRDRSSRRPLVALAVIVGLSFAAFENVSYVLASPSLLILRTALSVPLHGSATVIASAALIGSFGGKKISLLVPIIGAIAAHALFNLALSTGGLMVMPVLLCAVAVMVAVKIGAWMWRDDSPGEESWDGDAR
ncbi:MAG TPA: PrsW family glutamic-type intramembrane protease [Treponemataceae bacterium]|nr:PrsW family glutamic-type intramembrane protease [Treponemataceae bacterium]